MRLIQVSLLASALLATGVSHAARALDAPPPTREAVVNAPQADAAAQADDRTSLRQGVISAIGTKGDAVLINGSWLGIVNGQTVLFRQGKPVRPDVLRKGQQLRFTLAPGAADRRTLGVVYVP
jgi:hypothetical protein